VIFKDDRIRGGKSEARYPSRVEQGGLTSCLSWLPYWPLYSTPGFAPPNPSHTSGPWGLTEPSVPGLSLLRDSRPPVLGIERHPANI